MTTLEDIVKLDQNDPLSHFKQQFNLPKGMIYLDGNSLGAQPTESVSAVQTSLQQWETQLIKGWNQGWFDAPETLGNQLAPLLGADEGEVLINDNISLNIYKLIGYITQTQKSTRRIVLSEGGNFPTDGYVAQGFCRFTGFEHQFYPEGSNVADYLSEDVAVVVMSHVHYRTGKVRDMARITDQVHAAGAEIIWDLAHSAGAIPVELNRCNARYAVGCTYKYLNGGPGSPGFIYVHKDAQSANWQPLSGWHGHAAPFAFEEDYRPSTGITSFRSGTHSALIYSALEASIKLWSTVSISTVRDKSIAMTTLFQDCIRDICEEHDIRDITPEVSSRGSQVSLINQEHGYGIVQAMIDRGVIGDYREPGLIRFGFTPLYLSFQDVWDAAEHFRSVLNNKEFLSEKYKVRENVT